MAAMHPRGAGGSVRRSSAQLSWLESNALALAIGVIIGAALGTVVASLVDDIIMPPIGLLLGGVDFARARDRAPRGEAGRSRRRPSRRDPLGTVSVKP